MKGSTRYRLLLEESIRTTAVFGRCHWPEPTARLANETQLLNVAGWAVVVGQAAAARQATILTH